MLQLFTANQVGGAERNAAVQVALRLRQRRFLHVDVGLQLFAVDHQLAGLTDAGGQRGLCFFKRLLGVGWIESHQHIAFLHKVGIVSPDFRHAARHLRHNLYLVPCHVRVVSLFSMTQY